uniref:Uncharacterized protein n=1 Tax=Siphoviridae sp. ctjOC2 TaxID=2825632 RepID=A0A8S5Q957_9CAUD|nr:MAG TPA: hypothetical protein [Siphoviridae sp. ctjOC2]
MIPPHSRSCSRASKSSFGGTPARSASVIARLRASLAFRASLAAAMNFSVVSVSSDSLSVTPARLSLALGSIVKASTGTPSTSARAVASQIRGIRSPDSIRRRLVMCIVWPAPSSWRPSSANDHPALFR